MALLRLLLRLLLLLPSLIFTSLCTLRCTGVLFSREQPEYGALAILHFKALSREFSWILDSDTRYALLTIFLPSLIYTVYAVCTFIFHAERERERLMGLRKIWQTDNTHGPVKLASTTTTSSSSSFSISYTIRYSGCAVHLLVQRINFIFGM